MIRSRVEPAIGLVSACLPSMVHLFRKAVRRISFTLSTKRTKSAPSEAGRTLEDKGTGGFEWLGEGRGGEM